MYHCRTKNEKYILYCHIQEYEDICKDASTMDSLQKVIYKHKGKWNFIIAGDLLIMTVEYNLLDIETVIRNILTIQIDLASNGILISGMIDKGVVKWYDDKMVYGEGLVKIMKYIKRKKNYPRILIGDELCTYGIKSKKLIHRTSDPIFHFLDYLNPTIIYSIDGRYIGVMTQMQKLIRIGLDKYRYQKSEHYQPDLSKYEWLERYYKENLRPEVKFLEI